MAINVQCPNPDCGELYRVSEEKLGKQRRCNKCGTQFTLTSQTDTSIARETQAGSKSTHPASSPDSKTHRRLGRFEIRGRLGSGAFGTVYRAHDPQLDREVALKVPHPDRMRDPQVVKRFINEAKAAARLQHPHIVPVFDAGKDGQRYYIASAFIEGETLDAAIGKRKLEFRETARIVMQLAEALAYAHKQGIVHRDVKPPNVMLDGNGEPHLMDFGLARLETSDEKLTQDGSLMGTPAYMSPEQARGDVEAVGPASDQYSLGATLYEMLCGEVPFSGPPEIVIFNVIQTEPPASRSIKPDIPRDLETICQKAMAKEQERRYNDCVALADDLRRWLVDEPIAARPAGLVERTLRWCRREPRLASVTGLAAACLLAALLILTVSVYKFAESTAREQLLRKTAEAQRDRAEQNAYVNQIALAQRHILANDIERASDLLRKCPESLRQWEWNYLAGLCQLEILTFESHDTPIAALAWSSDGRRIASGGRRDGLSGGDINLWDPANGAVHRVLPGHDSNRTVFDRFTGEAKPTQPDLREVEALVFSPDDRRLISIGAGTFTVWNPATGKKLLHKKTGRASPLHDVALSHDGQQVAIGCELGVAKVWDTTTGEAAVVLDVENEVQAGYGLAFSPDDRLLAVGTSHQTVLLFDAGTGRVIRTLTGHQDYVYAVAFSPDGTRIVTGGSDKTAAVWNVATGRRLFTLSGHTRAVNTVAFSPNGRWIATGSGDSTIQLWNAATGERSQTLRGHTGGVHVVKFSPDGSSIASGAGDRTVKLWRVGAHRFSGASEAVHTLKAAGSGRHFVPSRRWPIKLTGDATTTTEVNAGSWQYHDACSLGFSADSGRVSYAGWQNYKVWVVAAVYGSGGWLRRIAFSPDGQWVASAYDASRVKVHEVHDPAGNSILNLFAVKVWNTSTGKEVLSLSDQSRTICAIRFSPDSAQIAVARCQELPMEVTRNHTITTYEVSSGRQATEIAVPANVGTITTLSYSPDGKTIASAGAGMMAARHDDLSSVMVWDVKTGKRLQTLQGHSARVNAVLFSPDGRWMATAGLDRTVKLWNVQTGTELRELKGHTSAVNSLACTPDAQRLASADMDGGIKIWDPETGQEFLTLKGPAKALEFSPDGRWLAGTDGSSLELWDGGQLKQHDDAEESERAGKK